MGNTAEHTVMMANIGATNVQMAYVPLPEDSQQLQNKENVAITKLFCTIP